MGRLRRTIHEVHRRSIWQVLAVYLAGSWVALQVVDALTRTAGLPDWVPPFSIVLLVIGLPIVLGTAIVQEGAPVGSTSRPGPGPVADPGTVEPASAPPSAPLAEPGAAQAFFRKHLTWKRAILGGVAAFVLLGGAVAAYFTMRATGVGPVASLVAQGVLEEREPILLTDFRNRTDDPTLGAVVTEALRVDLTSSRVVALVEAAQLEDALRRMGRDPNTPLTPEVAREVAVRDGIKAVIEGEVGAAGSAYVLTATLRRGEDGASLASFRRTARNPDAVIDAIDRLSQDIRERVGESLRSIRGGASLSQATTSSLDALRRYTEAEDALRRGDETAGLALLREAVALDTAFAMAYRKEATILANMRIEPERRVEALERAYRHRARLTERERHLTEALYHAVVTGDLDAVVRAYEAALRMDPQELTALNNLANEYQARGELPEAEELYRRALAGPERSPIPYQNLVRNQLRQGDREGAREAVSAYAEAHPEDTRVREMAALVHAMSGNVGAAEQELRALLDAPGVPVPRRADAHAFLGWLAAATGRMGEARQQMELAVRAAAEVAPGMEWFYRAAAAWVEVRVSGDGARARVWLDEAQLRRVRDGLPAQAPVNHLTSQALIELGDRDGALAWIGDWRARTPREQATPTLRAEQALFEAWARSGGDDPEAVLEAIGTFRREVRCPRCFEEVWAPLLHRAGRAAEAREAWKGLRDRLLPQWGISVIIMGQTLEQLGVTSEELGDHAAAAEAYRRFIDLWSEADPELQPRVERARERLALLDAAPAS